MIARSVKRLRRHGLLREPVDIAMDFHDVCRYDEDPNIRFMRYSKHKNGTHLFNTLASVHIRHISGIIVGIVTPLYRLPPVIRYGAIFRPVPSGGCPRHTRA